MVEHQEHLRHRIMYYHMEILKNVDVIVTPTTGSHFVLGQRLPPLGGDGGGGGIGDGSGGGGEGGGVLGNSKENQRGKEDEGISVISHTFGPY
ncbi:hypothetical protein Tco_1571410 [Tanacetum coccineum]